MILGPLFHWSPSVRHEQIRAEGLRPKCAPTVATETQPHLCFSLDPATAWEGSAAMDWVAHIDAWDLWQVQIGDDDEVRIRPEFGPAVNEVQVHGPIPSERLWWCGRRSP